MKIGIISFTEHGSLLAQKLAEALEQEGFSCEAAAKMSRPLPDGCSRVRMLSGSLKDWVGTRFESCGALVFIGATGIAVRGIAPYVKSKKTDPSVIVVDEQGRHAISLLSGHIGGANGLTLQIARILGAEPVITTATDLNHKFAVDAFATKRDLYIDDMVCAKEIAACLVAGEQIGMHSDFPVYGNIPEELVYQKAEEEMPKEQKIPEIGFSVTVQKENPFSRTVHLVPRILTLGIGCRRNTEAAHLERIVTKVLEEQRIFREGIRQIASIDLKKEEPAILSLAEKWNRPFWTYTAEELKMAVCEDGFEESEFVRSVTGVGNVCERAALLASGSHRLLLRKVAREGVTVALATEEFAVWMED